MRLVLDTNVVVSALLWRGAPYRLIESIRRQVEAVSVYTSAPMLVELADVLSRPQLGKRLDAIALTATEVLTDFATFADIVEPTPVHGVAPDADDDIVIGTAVAAGADFIVTGDARLLGVGQYRGISIITVGDATARLTR